MNIRLSSLMSLVLACGLGLLFGLGRPAYAAFGVTSSGGYYTVDTGAGLVFKVNNDDSLNSLGSSGDITSLRFNGIEVQDQSRFSHIASGFGGIYSGNTKSVSLATYGSDFIKITVTAATATKTLTHYYMVRNGLANIYMATYISDEPDVGELRYIARLQSSKLPDTPRPSDLTGNSGAIESSDVFGMANGETRSKYFGRDRAIELGVRGVRGPGIGVWMVYDNRESSSGGPFYRDIQNQTAELYNYMNSGHQQTEAIRKNALYGPYVYAFTSGAAPSGAIDTSWIGGLGLTGWVGDANRGRVSGIASGIPAGFEGVVGWANARAQGWRKIDAGSGAFSSPPMIPGDYTMTLYKGELAVATRQVSIVAGTTVTQNIASTEIVPFSRFRIGEWDGTPAGFLNSDKIIDMHPSDVRMKPWGPVNYTVGTSSVGDFPAYGWKDVNNPTTIQFTLAPGEVAAHTLRVGIAAAQFGARPQVRLNAWNSAIPAPSSQPDSRSLTLGTYRGNNTTYTYNIPASAFVAGTNTLTLTVVSGSGSARFLSAGYAYDCVELNAPYSGAFRFTPQHAQGKALAIANSNPENGAQTVISGFQTSAGQQFLLDRQSDGTYRIRSGLAGNRVVELPFGNASDGSLIKLWDDNGNAAQRWNIVPVEGEWVKIVPKNDGSKSMEVAGGEGATASGTPVQSWTYFGGAHQKWKLTPMSASPLGAAPRVQGDSYTLDEDTSLSVAAPNGILANDSDSEPLLVADSDTTQAGIQPLTGPAHGALVLNADGSFSYTPAPNFAGSDSFTYQASDGALLSDAVTVSFSVNDVADSAPFLSIGDIRVAENRALASFTLTLSAPSPQTVTADYATADGSALAGSDYLATSGTVSFAPGETTKSVDVPLVNDTQIEGDETFSLDLSAPGGALLADAQGVATLTNDDFDTVSPAVSITAPANRSFGVRLTSVSGAAQDNEGGTGIARVDLFFKRQSDGKYWNGSVWNTTAPVALATSLQAGGAWSKTSGLPLTNTSDLNQKLLDGSYLLTATAFDNAGNSQSASSLFTLDKINPTVSITTPLNQGFVTSLLTISGTALDNVGGSGIVRLDVFLKRNADGKYWTGTAWGNATPVALPAGLNKGGWGLTGAVLPSVAASDVNRRLLDGAYSVTAVAYDRVGNQKTTSSLFTVDRVNPTVAITTPAHRSIVISLPSVLGTALDNAGGSGVARLDVFLRRSSDGLYWNGEIWNTATPVALAVGLNKGNWGRSGSGLPLPNAADPRKRLTPGDYTLFATAFDKASNRKSTSNFFTVARVSAAGSSAAQF